MKDQTFATFAKQFSGLAVRTRLFQNWLFILFQLVMTNDNMTFQISKRGH